MKCLIYCIALLLLTQSISAADNNSWWQRAIGNALLSSGYHGAQIAWNYATIRPQPSIQYTQGPPSTLQEIAAKKVAQQIKGSPDIILDLPSSILNLVAKEYYLAVDHNLPEWLKLYFEGVSIDDLIRHGRINVHTESAHLSNLYINNLQGFEKIPAYDFFLTSNRLQTLPDNFNPQNLRDLSLGHNQLQTLPVNFNPRNLQHLSLEHNQLQTLPDDFNPQNLQYLFLGDNKLQTLPNNFNPPNLRILSLRDNKLQALPVNFNPPRLERLNIRGNPMSKETIAALRQRLPHVDIWADAVAQPNLNIANNNPYTVLGIEPNASNEDIKTIYRKLIIRYHPDKNPGNPAAEDIFKRITEAYRQISKERNIN